MRNQCLLLLLLSAVALSGCDALDYASQFSGWQVFEVPSSSVPPSVPSSVPTSVPTSVPPSLPSSCIVWDEERGQMACPPNARVSGRLIEPDLGSLLARERPAARSLARERPATRSEDFFTQFRSQAEIEAQLATYDAAQLIMTTIGTTIENRPIRLVRINVDSVDMRWPIVFVNSGLHAREWLGPMTTMWSIDFIMSHLNLASVSDFEYHFIVISNPDGYEYSRTTQRQWRKNRRPGTCVGVDPNRNFDDRWGLSGSSTNQCSEVYRGPSAASEPEVQAIQNHAQLVSNRTVAFIDVHSYFGSLTSVYGYATNVYPPNYAALQIMMQRAQAAGERVNGLRYAIGTDADVLGAASGGSDDYTYSAGIEASFTVELRGNSFVAPVSDIVLSGSEFTAALFGLLDVSIDTNNSASSLLAPLMNISIMIALLCLF